MIMKKKSDFVKNEMIVAMETFFYEASFVNIF